MEITLLFISITVIAIFVISKYVVAFRKVYGASSLLDQYLKIQEIKSTKDKIQSLKFWQTAVKSWEEQ